MYPSISEILLVVYGVLVALLDPADGYAAAASKSLQSCLTLCDPMDGSPPGSPDPGILPAKTLEWVAISFSNAWKWKVKVNLLSRVRLLATPWTLAHQAPPSMGFSRQEYWSEVPLPSPECFMTVIYLSQQCISSMRTGAIVYFTHFCGLRSRILPGT